MTLSLFYFPIFLIPGGFGQDQAHSYLNGVPEKRKFFGEKAKPSITAYF